MTLQSTSHEHTPIVVFCPQLIVKIVMATHCEDKETIVTSLLLTNGPELNMFMKDKWDKWKKYRNQVTILIICGAHVKSDGSIGKEIKDGTESLDKVKVRLQNILFEMSKLTFF